MTKLESLEKLRDGISRMVTANHFTPEDEMKFKEIADAIQTEIDKRFMELPVDADGVPWTSMDSKFDAVVEGVIELIMIAYSVKTGRWYLLDDAKMAHAANLCRHVKPRTVEDVLQELLVDVKYGVPTHIADEAISHYAAELQMRGDA